MITTTMLGLTNETLKAKLSQYDQRQYYYPTLFPLKQAFSLTWKTLEAQTGFKIMADLVARGSRLDPKMRDAISAISGDMPKIAIKRVMTEEEMYNYQLMLNMGNPEVTDIVNAWGNDVKFVYDGVSARREWMALYQISRGKLSVKNDNNTSIITNIDVTYPIPTDQKSGFLSGSAAWSNKTNAKPISIDLTGVAKAMYAKGKVSRFMFMTPDTFALFSQTDEVVNYCKPFMAAISGATYYPDIETVNNVLARQPLLYGLQIRIIDQLTIFEKADGTRVTANPFANNVVLYSDSDTLGTTLWMEPVDMKNTSSVALKAMNAGICIKRYAIEEPLEETTIGISNSFSTWDNYSNCYLQDVKNSSWAEGV